MKRWNTANCDNVNGTWEYHAKQSKPDRKSWKPYNCTHMWDVRLTLRYRHGSYQQEEVLEVVKGKCGQIYGDGR